MRLRFDTRGLERAKPYDTLVGEGLFECGSFLGPTATLFLRSVGQLAKHANAQHELDVDFNNLCIYIGIKPSVVEAAVQRCEHFEFVYNDDGVLVVRFVLKQRSPMTTIRLEQCVNRLASR
jgi:hypothetical protein